MQNGNGGKRIYKKKWGKLRKAEPTLCFVFFSPGGFYVKELTMTIFISIYLSIDR